MRLTIVAREPVRAAANAAAARLGQGLPFNAPLVEPAAPGTVVARWCSWEMKQGERDDLLAGFRAEGFSAREANVIDAQRSPRLTDRLFVFDGDFYSPDSILAALGLEPFAAPE